ncbi:hypothetical protein JL722_11385 [Aureococcus anophagefferens]|nr:hypothetical protein JL722_11385 [Aureococcus anophagefferens]
MGNVRFKHGLPAARSGAMAAFGQRRRISQQAFDACVAENVEDCGMGREEAVWNAYEHFDFQNADLSAVDPDGPGERREARDVLRIQVALLARGVGGATRAELDAALAFVAAACGRDAAPRAAAAARATVVAARGLAALAALVDACVEDGDRPLLLKCLPALAASVRGDAARAFRYGGCVEAVLRVLRAAASAGDRRLGRAGLAVVAAAAAGTEGVKAPLVAGGACPLTVELVLAAVEAGDARLGAVACRALAAVAAADDPRAASAGAAATATKLADAGAVNAFAALAAFGDEAAARAAVDGLALLAASEDAAAEIVRAGGARACRDALRERRGSAARRRGLAGVLRHLAGDDGAKDAMCADGTLEELLEVLETFRDEDPALGEHVVACLARMALRRPANAAKIGVAGGALVVAAMAAHPAHAGLNRQGALALRNLVARNPEHAAPLLAAGAEAALRAAAAADAANVDVAFAALRGLGVEAAMAPRGDADPPRLL